MFISLKEKKIFPMPQNSMINYFTIPFTVFKVLFFLLILFFQSSLFSETASSGFKIEHFAVMDASADHYDMAVSGPDEEELCRILKGFDSDKEFKIKLSGIKTEIYKGSLYTGTEANIQGFYFNAFADIPPNPKAKLELFLSKNGREEKLDEAIVAIPATSAPDKQPIITKLKPSGGVTGDTLVIQGKNFGRDIDKIEIYLHDSSLDEKKAALAAKSSNTDSKEPQACLDTYVADPNMPSEYNTMLIKISPATLSQPDPKTGIQELSFSIPEDLDEIANENFLRKKLNIRININGRNSRFALMTILPDNWNKKIILFSVFMTVFGLGLISWMLRKWNMLPNILIDNDTNTYSLSRFQAFAWTVVLLGSYFYIAICTGLVLRDGVIPDFNPSLIGLMSISYTGLISSHFLGKRNPKNEITHQPPALSNLFSENGVVDISRLQLLCFTAVAIIVYLYNLGLGNILNGLPDIPPTLHGLLLTSQGSYIGAKIFGDKIAVNRIFPNMFAINDLEMEFNLVGGGFVDGIKVMLEGSDKPPVTAIYSSPSSMSCKLESDGIPGKKTLLLIPPSGTSITLHGVLEITDIEKLPEAAKSESQAKESKPKKKSKP